MCLIRHFHLNRPHNRLRNLSFILNSWKLPELVFHQCRIYWIYWSKLFEQFVIILLVQKFKFVFNQISQSVTHSVYFMTFQREAMSVTHSVYFMAMLSGDNRMKRIIFITIYCKTEVQTLITNKTTFLKHLFATRGFLNLVFRYCCSLNFYWNKINSANKAAVPSLLPLSLCLQMGAKLMFSSVLSQLSNLNPFSFLWYVFTGT